MNEHPPESCSCCGDPFDDGEAYRDGLCRPCYAEKVTAQYEDEMERRAELAAWEASRGI